MHKKKKGYIIAGAMILTVLMLIILDNTVFRSASREEGGFLENILHFGEEQEKDYSEELSALAQRNPEAAEFAANYPLYKDGAGEYTLTEYEDLSEIPHFMQWDTRWGYEEYAGSLMGLSGCGPVCLSMVAVYLLEDLSLDPLCVARFSEDNGYAEKDNGTKWTLMSKGAEELGLRSRELPLHKQTMIDELDSGKPIICIMGAGDFTSSGHFIVITDYSDEGFSVLDPNSVSRSQQKWTYERIESQIRNLWAFSKS
ncbi:MAG: C39 family peptidase [Clostridia bacterium]|nr:C39 family peptidase [Clostridia bacterium]